MCIRDRRIASETQPLVISRSMGTTNVDASRFTDSMSITDWQPFQYLEPVSYTHLRFSSSCPIPSDRAPPPPAPLTYSPDNMYRPLIILGLLGAFAAQGRQAGTEMLRPRCV